LFFFYLFSSVTDILLAALTDTLNEHPELVEQGTKESGHSNLKLNQKNDRGERP